MSDLVQRAGELRAGQMIEEALETIIQAAKAAPDDPRTAFFLAQLSFEGWRPAAHLFARAAELNPGHSDLIRNQALAMAAEGQGGGADALLEATLAANPGWIDGHRTLTTMRVTGGEGEGFDRSFAAAVQAQPANPALWMGWFQQHAMMKQWDAARRILAQAQRAIGGIRALDMAALYLDSESGEGGDLASRFAVHTGLGDPGMDLCAVRYWLRRGEPVQAEAIAERHGNKPSARMFWPYLALCWRLSDDRHAAWLDGDPLHVSTFDLDFSAAELAALASVLRGLHRLKAPWPEQSVRGGTQTDRQLFFHPDPAIQNARSKITQAVRSYIDQLPAPDASHPLLGQPRDSLLFEGSWSVRLAGAGHHASHTHVMGWISSAFYVALPDEMGEAPAGHLAFGAPPPELNLGLGPMRHIGPKPGRLALFPSTLWHATEPFATGERLTIAFDVAIPAPIGKTLT